MFYICHFRIIISLWNRHTWGNWVTQRSSNLSRTPQLICKWAMIQMKTWETVLTWNHGVTGISFICCSPYKFPLVQVPDPRHGMSNGRVSRMDVGAEAWWLGTLYPACSPCGCTALVTHMTRSSGQLDKMLWHGVCSPSITVSPLAAILFGSPMQVSLLCYGPRVETFLLGHEILTV